MIEKTAKMKEGKRINLARARNGVIATRGRTFQGKVVKKFDKRVVVEFERTVKVPKYERFAKKRTRLHARIPEGLEVKEGDHVKIRECRPLSKIIHFQVVEILKGAEK